MVDTRFEERKRDFCRSSPVDIKVGRENYASMLRKSSRSAAIEERRVRAVCVSEPSPVLATFEAMVISSAEEIGPPTKLATLAEQLRSVQKEEQVLRLLAGVRELARKHQTTARELVATGVAQFVLAALNPQNSTKLQAEAAWIVSILTMSESAVELSPLLDLGCTQLLIPLIAGPNAPLVEHVRDSHYSR